MEFESCLKGEGLLFNPFTMIGSTGTSFFELRGNKSMQKLASMRIWRELRIESRIEYLSLSEANRLIIERQ